MRKKPKKLELHLETLRTLDELVLEPVAGGTASACLCSITNCTVRCNFEPVGCGTV